MIAYAAQEIRVGFKHERKLATLAELFVLQ